MIGLLVAVGVVCAAGFAVARSPSVLPPVLTVPCDECGRPVTPADAHVHHHDDGCGIDDPHREQCRCDHYRCAACCPCDRAGVSTSPLSPVPAVGGPSLFDGAS